MYSTAAAYELNFHYGCFTTSWDMLSREADHVRLGSEAIRTAPTNKRFVAGDIFAFSGLNVLLVLSTAGHNCLLAKGEFFLHYTHLLF